MKLGVVRNAVLIRIPDEMKLLIYHEFGDGDVAEGLLFGYVSNHDVRQHLKKLLAER